MNVGDRILTKQYVQYTVTDLIGQGGQGYVFLVENQNIGKKVLKWYFEEQATERQRKAIENAIRIGAPDEDRDGTFIWPQDIVEDRVNGGFGYIMEYIDMSRYCEYIDMISDETKVPSLRIRCIISYNLIRAYQRLHLRGYCYRDVSDGNFLFDIKTGGVAICDNDNVGVEGESSSQVLGTFEYMAPEILRREAKPGMKTDLYSLAVLLFKFWVWHHPYHGKMEYECEEFDNKAKLQIYGKDPVFIMNPNDRRNALPIDPETGELAEGYADVPGMWDLLPAKLKSAFMHSFTVGINDPDARLREYDWLKIFTSMLDNITYCPKDKAEVFALDKNLRCWYCGEEVKKPQVLTIKNMSGIYPIALTSNMRIYGYHLDEFHKMYRDLDILGYMSRNPKNPNVWGIYNGTNRDWLYSFADGHTAPIKVGMHAPVLNGARIYFNPESSSEERIIGFFGTGKKNE